MANIQDGQFFHINELGNDRTFRFVSGSLMEIKNPNYRYNSPVVNYSKEQVGTTRQNILDSYKTAKRVPDLIKDESGLFGPERVGITQHGLNMGGSKPIVSVPGITFGTEGTQSGDNFVHESGVSHSQTYTDAQGQVHSVQKGSDAEKSLIDSGATKGGNVQYNKDGSIQNTTQNTNQDTTQNNKDTTSQISAQDYQLQPGETTDQYNQRIAALRGEAPQPMQSQQLASAYTGPSVVDYLDSVGQASDFGSRATLAKQYGIPNYTGTSEQNTQLLSKLRTQGGYAPAQTSSQMGTNAPATGNYTATDTPAPVDIKDTFASFGVDLGDLQNFMRNPVASFEDTYDKLYKNLGIADLKSQASKLLKQATDIDSELADKVSDINDDPWLTEGVRVSRIQKLQERYDLKKAAVTNTLALYDKTIDSATDQARFLVKGLYDQYNADRNFTADMIGFIYDRVDKANQAQADIEKEAARRYESDREYDLDVARLKIDEYNATKPGSGGSDGMFSAAQINATVNQIAGAFDNEPIVKNFNILNEGYQFAQSLSNTTTNPADDQALIYAFAKAMDPNSVVREGEYNTVQKYAQSWVNSYGKSVTQAIAGTGFLSQSARANIKKTIEQRYAASLGNYQNVQTQYQQRIDNALAGQGNTLTNYSLYNTPAQQDQNQIPLMSAQNEPAPGFLSAINSFLYGNY